MENSFRPTKSQGGRRSADASTSKLALNHDHGGSEVDKEDPGKDAHARAPRDYLPKPGIDESTGGCPAHR